VTGSSSSTQTVPVGEYSSVLERLACSSYLREPSAQLDETAGAPDHGSPALLLTKLHPPPTRNHTVARVRLLERLQPDVGVKVFVVAAPGRKRQTAPEGVAALVDGRRRARGRSSAYATQRCAKTCPGPQNRFGSRPPPETREVASSPAAFA
jgi:hypothetical protein